MKRGKKVITFLTAVLMAVLMVMPVSAAGVGNNANEAVSKARNGVLQIQLVYVDQAANEWTLQGGSGFLIGATNGAEYMITNYHVVSLTDEKKAEATAEIGVDFFSQTNLNQIQIKVVVKRDVTINASVVNYSDASNMDFAILKLEQPIYDRESLIIDDDDNHVKETMDIYALGFPADVVIAEMRTFSETPLYTSADVNITGGIVSNTTSLDNVKYVRHSVVLSGGNSGGPLVNNEGHVIGVNRMGIADTQYNYSLQISEVTSVLNALGITYRKPEESEAVEQTAEAEPVVETEPAPVQEAVDKTNLSTQLSLAQSLTDLDVYTEGSVAALNAAIDSAKSAMDNAGATQSEVDAAAAALNTARTGLTENPGPNMALIIGIIAAAIVVIVIVIVIVLLSGSKKKKTTSTGAQPYRPTPPAAQPKTAPQQQTPLAPNYANFGSSEGSGETSVLNQGSGETSVLGSNAPQISAMLARRKNGENIQINKQLFKIGKERVRVDYCIPDNNSISRVHAQIIFKNNAYFIMDMKSTNYTYVNGNKIIPEQEMKLNSGDKIRLADEEFEFRC